MAKVKFGAVVTDIRGSEGGTVFSRNASGAYIRNKVTPVNPNSPRQQIVRGRLSEVAKRWGTLAPGLRIAWKNFAINHPITNAFGAVVTLSGLAMYQKINGVLLNLGVAILDTPPANFDIPDVVTDEINVSASGRIIETVFTPDTPGPSIVLQARMTAAHSPGIDFVKPLLRFVGTTTPNPVSELPIAIPSSFGTLIEGETRSVSVSFASQQNGAVSVPVILKLVVAF